LSTTPLSFDAPCPGNLANIQINLIAVFKGVLKGGRGREGKRRGREREGDGRG